MDPYLLQWRLYNHNLRNENLWSITYKAILGIVVSRDGHSRECHTRDCRSRDGRCTHADQYRHVTKKTTDSSYVYYDCRGATVGDRGSMAWMPAYIAVSNLRSMISMIHPSASFIIQLKSRMYSYPQKWALFYYVL
jgi:hypothetical protein